MDNDPISKNPEPNAFIIRFFCKIGMNSAGIPDIGGMRML